MSWDVACFGELVVDLVPHTEVGGQWLYAPNPGGAPGNVAVGLSRLGRRVVMIGKVGNEAFGRMLVAALEGYGVDASGVTSGGREKTSLSVVALGPDGDRDFFFYRDDPAELAIDADDLSGDLIARSKVLHLGVLPMSAPRSAAAQSEAIRIAKAAGRLISADPNFRPALWPDREVMLQAGRELIAEAAIVKVSEDELFAMAGAHTIEGAVRSLWHDDLRFMAVTRGARGAELFTATDRLVCHGYTVDAVDTTAAGDAFAAALLSGLLDHQMLPTNRDDLVQILRSACAAGAMAATMKGAMGSLPAKSDLVRFLTDSRENLVGG